MYLAYCVERARLIDALAAGVPAVSTLPVWQDASANGFQHMALLLRDEELAKKVNLLPLENGERADIYKIVAEKMTARLKALALDNKRAPAMGISEAKERLRRLQRNAQSLL